MERFLASLAIVQTIFYFIHIFNMLFREPERSAFHCMVTSMIILLIEITELLLGDTGNILLLILWIVMFISAKIKYALIMERIKAEEAEKAEKKQEE